MASYMKTMDCGAELQNVLEEIQGSIRHGVRPGTVTMQRWHDRLRAVQTHIGIYGPNIHDSRTEVQMNQPSPLKTLVAEYLFEQFDAGSERAWVDIQHRHRILTDFLTWEETRRTPPAFTRKGILDGMTAHPVFSGESTKP